MKRLLALCMIASLIFIPLGCSNELEAHDETTVETSLEDDESSLSGLNMTIEEVRDYLWDAIGRHDNEEFAEDWGYKLGVNNLDPERGIIDRYVWYRYDDSDGEYDSRQIDLFEFDMNSDLYMELEVGDTFYAHETTIDPRNQTRAIPEDFSEIYDNPNDWNWSLPEYPFTVAAINGQYVLCCREYNALDSINNGSEGNSAFPYSDLELDWAYNTFIALS